MPGRRYFRTAEIRSAAKRWRALRSSGRKNSPVPSNASRARGIASCAGTTFTPSISRSSRTGSIRVFPLPVPARYSKWRRFSAINDERQLAGIGPGSPVDHVLEECGEGSVVLRRGNHEGVMLAQNLLERPDRRRPPALRPRVHLRALSRDCLPLSISSMC